MKKLLVILTFVVLTLPIVANATLVNWSINHSFVADLVITLGAGDTSNPDWSQIVQNHSWTYNGSFIIPTTAEQYVNNNSWWLYIDDQYYWDSGTLTAFSITLNDGTIIESNDTPMFLPDRSRSYAYLQTPHNPVPEPSSMLLFGFGMTGLVGYKIKK